MRKSTRLLALILMALMLVGMVPFALFADETSGDATDTETTTPDEDGRGGLPTYERDTTEEKIPSETKFGDGELGRKEELSDVAP